VTSSIASFQSQPLNTTILPGGIWSFYLHSYKQNTNASFNIFVELYKITSGGTQTLLFSTDPAPVTTNSPNPSMQLTDGYFSGTPLSVSDGIVAVVRATNTGNQSHSITLVTEGTSHYSYVVSTIPTQQGLTCDTLSGCSIIQTIQTNVSNKLDKSGGTITGNLIINSGLTANTFSASTYLGLPIDIRVTGATKSGSVATFRNNTGGTFTLTGLTDVFVTGGTHSLTGGTTTLRNNTGGTFNVSGYFTPSNDIYVTSGSVDHGPSSDADNLLLLTRSDLTNVTISNLVNISPATKSEIDSLIASRWIIRGKTYKISGCDNSLYDNGTDRNGDPVYTSIYLMGLEGNKLSESGVGVFYTPKYSEFDIFVEGTLYGQGDIVIWGGYVWECTGAAQVSIDLFTLDPRGFDIIYPFDDSNNYNQTYYNIQYDDIIYDYTNDKIIYRNEQNSNIVSTTYENINYWIDDMGLYNPIRAFQWGNVYTNTPNGIGDQRIINSYNENINYRGLYQKDFYFNNLSYQRDLYVEDPLCYQSNFIFDNKSYQSVITLISNGNQSDITLNNGSYQTSISFQGVDGYPSTQSFFNFNNGSYQDNIDIRSGDGIPGFQNYFNFNNNSYQTNITLRERHQNRLDFTNNSGQDTIDGCNQDSLIFDSSTQVNGNGFNQLNITIKNYDRDLSSVTVNEQDEYYIHNLPSDDTAPVYIGKINNRLVEVTVGGGVSDLRTKNNIEYITGDTSSIINQLKPVKFEFNNYSGITRHGFIAQDVLEIDSKLVLGDGKKENGMYSLDYYGILSLTVKSLQEANNRIDVLEKIIKDSQPK
jgi:hypothetical protein